MGVLQLQYDGVLSGNPLDQLARAGHCDKTEL